MKVDFLQPRFDGARFVEHTLPLEVARDLAAYETLVIELAKHLYLQEHADRQRVPKGFAADFHLHLEKIDEGSARPLLALVAAGALALGPGTEIYFERARDLISDCIAAPEGQLPDDFPRELLTHFNQIGRSLGPDERMEIPRLGTNPAILTPERRKHLVLAAEQVYERPIELNGTIEEADWEKSTFRLRLADGTKIIVPMSENFHAKARNYGGRHRHQVSVQGIGAFDSWDRLQKLVSVEVIDVQDDYQLLARFEELRNIEDHWHDGAGIAPDKNKLDRLAGRLAGHYPEKLPLPTIVPTPEGNLLFEWEAEGDPSVDLNLTDFKAQFHAFNPGPGDIEREFDLARDEVWPQFFGFLSEHIQPSPA